MFGNLVFGVGVFLAFANGANDNFKGVATLYGSGTLSLRTALKLATAVFVFLASKMTPPVAALLGMLAFQFIRYFGQGI